MRLALWGTVTRWYKAGGKPVSEWRGNPLGDYAPIRLAALNEWQCYTRGGYAPTRGETNGE